MEADLGDHEGDVGLYALSLWSSVSMTDVAFLQLVEFLTMSSAKWSYKARGKKTTEGFFG